MQYVFANENTCVIAAAEQAGLPDRRLVFKVLRVPRAREAGGLAALVLAGLRGPVDVPIAALAKAHATRARAANWTAWKRI